MKYNETLRLVTIMFYFYIGRPYTINMIMSVASLDLTCPFKILLLIHNNQCFYSWHYNMSDTLCNTCMAIVHHAIHRLFLNWQYRGTHSVYPHSLSSFHGAPSYIKCNDVINNTKLWTLITRVPQVRFCVHFFGWFLTSSQSFSTKNLAIILNVLIVQYRYILHVY